MKEEMKLQNKSLATERSYIYWVKKFSEYVGSKIHRHVNQDDVKGFLTYLAVERSVAISTQKQAFNAILFLFRHILDKKIYNLDSVVRSKVKRRLPLVLSQREISEIIRQMKHPYRISENTMKKTILKIVPVSNYPGLLRENIPMRGRNGYGSGSFHRLKSLLIPEVV